MSNETIEQQFGPWPHDPNCTKCHPPKSFADNSGTYAEGAAVSSPSPLDQAWEDFKSSKVTRETLTDTVREAFNAGHKAGIAFCMDQVHWDVDNAAGHEHD